MVALLNNTNTDRRSRKHYARHDLNFRCHEPHCKRKDGFANANDLQRHQHSVHRKRGLQPNYKCFGESCLKAEKEWPRLDNFKCHLKKMHPHEDQEHLITRLVNFSESGVMLTRMFRRSRNWYESRQRQALIPQQTPPRPSAPIATSMRTPTPAQLFATSFSPFPDQQTAPNPEISRLWEIDPSSMAQFGQRSSFGFGPQSTPNVGTSTLGDTQFQQSFDPRHTSSDPNLASGHMLHDHDFAYLGSNPEIIDYSGVPKTLMVENNAEQTVSRQISQSLDVYAQVGMGFPQQRRDQSCDRSTAPLVLMEDIFQADDTLTQQSLHGLDSTTGSSNNIPSLSMAESSEPDLPVRDNKTQKLKCSNCPVTGRPCDVKKHMRRHDKPWKCTFDKCESQFGSKHDWKRHETSMHEQLECWRCEEPALNNTGRSRPVFALNQEEPCMSLSYTLELYQKHLTEMHRIIDTDLISNLSKKQKIGQRSQGQWWCGFCDKIIIAQKKGVPGVNERFDHIDEHFMKEKRKMNDWKPLDGRTLGTKRVVQQSVTTSPPRGRAEASHSEERNEALNVQVQRSPSRSTRQNPRKRPASVALAVDQEPSQEPARAADRFVVYCCGCNNFTQQWAQSCHDCNHVHCRNCRRERIEQNADLLFRDRH